MTEFLEQEKKQRNSPPLKKKFDAYVEECKDEAVPPIHNDGFNSQSDAPRSVTKRGSIDGISFVSQFGALDCSIGSIFRDEFGKNLKIPKTSSPQSMGRALSVLIIDDSIIQRKLTMRTLGGLIDEVMWMVEGVENGECALNLMESTPRVPDVIIVDQYMQTSGGRLLGHEVVAELRKNPAFDSAVIIGCTGSADIATPHFLEAGCDAVWSKPMPSKEEAQAQITSFLERRKKNSVRSSNIASAETPAAISQSTNSSAGPDNSCNAQSPVLQPIPQKSEPVFRQIQTARLFDGQSSYFVSSPAESVNAPVFQSQPVLNSTNEDVSNMTKAISSIHVKD